jgi:GNAT superfamily N-acetyltransferase
VSTIAITNLGPQHSMLVAHLVLESALSAREGVSDVRLDTWQRGAGQWAAAVIDGKVAGIAALDEHDGQELELIWIETRAAYQQRGVGSALLEWARSQAKAQGRPLFINSAPAAIGFYRKALPGVADQGTTFTLAA